MIRKRGDRWVALLYDPATKGKRWIGTYDSKREASQAEAEAKLERKRRREHTETCDEFAARWVNDYPRERESTNITYREQVKRFAQDFTGIALNDVSRPMARKWAIANPGNYKTVRAMFSDARRDGLCDENPFVNLRLPGSRGRRDLDVLTFDEVMKLAEHARSLRGALIEAFILTSAFTGMRPGELYALQWPHLRLHDMEIDVMASYSSKSQQTTAPKNYNHRSVVVPPVARDALLKVRKPSGHVFLTPTGKRLTGRTLHYHWDPIRKAAGMPEMALYELRHFAAAYLLNVLKIPPHQVAVQLGHTDGGVLVQRLYGHPSEVLAREAIKEAFGSNVVELPRRSVANGGAGA